jgi:hypothetical protein
MILKPVSRVNRRNCDGPRFHLRFEANVGMTEAVARAAMIGGELCIGQTSPRRGILRLDAS